MAAGGAPPGFDMSRSLLPTGGGTIHAMSGGSMPPSGYEGGVASSLIPTGPPIPIHGMRGGVLSDKDRREL